VRPARAKIIYVRTSATTAAKSIEIAFRVMANQGDGLLVIRADYPDRMNAFFQWNPRLSSRIAHHLEFPDYA